MATPAAVLSILVKTQGAQAAAAQLGGIDKSGRAAAGGLKRAESQAKRSSKTFSALGATVKGAGVLIGAAGLAKGVSTAVSEFREAQKVGAQTNAVLKSTGDAAKVTAKHVENLAGSISKKTGIDDETIQSSENMLLTFTKLRNETGKGNKIFDQATQTVTDMSVALGQSGKTSAIQLGKALNDPVKGITALRRVGVSFTQDQQKQIETMVKSGHTLEAQKTILKELRTEFGGSAAAQATAGDKLKVSLGNLAEAVGGIHVPALDDAARWATKLIDQFVRGQGLAKFKDFLGQVADKAKQVWEALKPLRGSVEAIFGWLVEHPNVAGIISGIAAAVFLLNAAMAANPLTLFALGIAAVVVGVVTAYREFKTFRNVVGAVADFFKGIWPTVADAAVSAFNAITGVVKAAWPTIVSVIKTGVAVVLAVFKAMWPVIKGYFQGGFTVIKGIITGAAQMLSGAVKVIRGVLHGNFREIWDGIKQIFRGGFTALRGLITGAAQSVGNAAKTIGTAILDAIVEAIKAGAKKFADAVSGIVKGVKGAVSGALGAINPFGDGLGFKPITTIPGQGGSLMGASSSLAPFAALGAQYGLHVSSGKRAAGSRTSSGGISYHGSGQAIDLADGRGPDAAKLAAFKALKSRYGSQLAELIYTPGGVGIKDGHPFRYTGAVAADHYDHVHVAFTGGKTALGQAGNRGDGVGAFMGDGLGSNAKAVYQFMRHKGFPPGQAAAWVGVLNQESGLSTTARNRQSGATGIAQWLGGRLANLKKRSDWRTLQGQLNFLWSELQGPERAAFNRIKGAKGVTDATSAITWGFERPGRGEANMPHRLSVARQAFNAFKGVGGRGATSTGGAGASTDGAARVNPFDMRMAQADLAVQQAQNQPATAVFAGGRRISSAMAQIGALTTKRKLIGARIRSIRKALKGHLSRAKRLSLTQELTQRLGEHAQLGKDIQALRTPAAVDTTGSIGGAGGDTATGDGSDPNQSLIDSNTALQAAIEAQIQADKEHADALNGVKAELKRQTDYATSIANTDAFQIKKYLADVLSGQVGGYGVTPRSFTPGAGVAFRY